MSGLVQLCAWQECVVLLQHWGVCAGKQLPGDELGKQGGGVVALTVFEVRGCCKVLPQFELLQLPVSVSASGVMSGQPQDSNTGLGKSSCCDAVEVAVPG